MNTHKTSQFRKIFPVVEFLLICVLMSGCGGKTQYEHVDKSEINAELINTYNDISMENAIISQHTLYPYQFIKNGSQLNELGKRDLSILAAHFKDYPGQLNIRRGNDKEDLYQARISHVVEQLAQAGVDTERISVLDEMAGGKGMSSGQVINILKSDEKARSSIRSKSPKVDSGVTR
jgi:hypothetical protein